MYRQNVRESKISRNWHTFGWSHDDSIVGIGQWGHCGRRSCWSSNEYSASLDTDAYLRCWSQTGHRGWADDSGKSLRTSPSHQHQLHPAEGYDSQSVPRWPQLHMSSDPATLDWTRSRPVLRCGCDPCMQKRPAQLNYRCRVGTAILESRDWWHPNWDYKN